MITDHLIIRRAAAEIARVIRGARVRDVGLLDDGRFAIVFGGRGARTLAVSPFATPPLVTLDDRELGLSSEPSWTRAIGAVLRGLTAIDVRARRGDRLLRIDFGSRSRFGVATTYQLLLELVPRFGNVVLLKDETIVAAAKTFSRAENNARSIEVGERYAAPPLPHARTDDGGFAGLIEAGAEREALRDRYPFVPRAVADSFVLQAQTISVASVEARTAWFARRAEALESSTSGESDGIGPIFVYRREGRLLAAHVVPLLQYGDAQSSEAPALIPFLNEAAAASNTDGVDDKIERRRVALRRAASEKLESLRAHIAEIAGRRADSGSRDRLRRAGELLHTYGVSIPFGASAFLAPEEGAEEIELDPTLDAKENAARYYALYRKAADALPHLERRAEILERSRDAVETIAWELERVGREDFAEFEADAASALGIRRSKRPPQTRKRKIVAIDRPSGARIYLGRSPRENVEVTFSIARPHDLWFHARNIPGAHVVLQRETGDGQSSSEGDIEFAARLAAGQSRAKNAPKVEVDYTQRKFVRKQRDAPPGLVWYTDFKSLLVVPLERPD